eukprot:TRINITY_DN603_c0_g1_i4.p1 TRINITY_DN603_c0_g1~~TRINITY_DN603_c0_g1_i4.p1  ORF type:complete len:169 (+),score=18.75 TRINITY_DN603_c0_g1_i4:173-679(+)
MSKRLWKRKMETGPRTYSRPAESGRALASTGYASTSPLRSGRSTTPSKLRQRTPEEFHDPFSRDRGTYNPASRRQIVLETYAPRLTTSRGEGSMDYRDPTPSKRPSNTPLREAGGPPEVDYPRLPQSLRTALDDSFEKGTMCGLRCASKRQEPRVHAARDQDDECRLI